MPKVEGSDLVLGPAIITMAVTLIRLTGELMGWSPILFNPEPGGPGAIVGIVWLVPIFGVYFAVKLRRSGESLRPGRLLGFALLGLAAFLAISIPTDLLMPASLTGQIIGMGAGALVGTAIAVKQCGMLGSTLLRYGLAARIPVVIVMLLAMLGDWGTHYDVAPPELPETGVFLKWIIIGVVPQLTTWLAFTVIFGTVCGSLVLFFRNSGKSKAA